MRYVKKCSVQLTGAGTSGADDKRQYQLSPRPVPDVVLSALTAGHTRGALFAGAGSGKGILSIITFE
jgi:hypothetical protein